MAAKFAPAVFKLSILGQDTRKVQFFDILTGCQPLAHHATDDGLQRNHSAAQVAQGLSSLSSWKDAQGYRAICEFGQSQAGTEVETLTPYQCRGVPFPNLPTQPGPPLVVPPM